MSGAGASGPGHPPAPTERIEAPLYLARFREREAQQALDDDRRRDGATPEGEAAAGGDAAATEARPLYERADLGTQQALTEDNRNKEISAPPRAQRPVLNDVYLIRHGETQGYSTDSGLTPQGAWQAHSYGRTMARRLRSGEAVVIAHARTNRARETAEQIHRGLSDGLAQYEKQIELTGPLPHDAFANFGFSSPDGVTDVTTAFRRYYAELEAFERSAAGDRPLWLVEMDRFWRTQQGGADPIAHWLTVPMLHFEPPSLCVRRFWSGVMSLSQRFPGARLAVATHSGPIRAFAVAALGYDPGEPYNVEHVRVKLLGEPGAEAARDAAVAYRNRVQEVKVPVLAGLPTWGLGDV